MIEKKRALNDRDWKVIDKTTYYVNKLGRTEIQTQIVGKGTKMLKRREET